MHQQVYLVKENKIMVAKKFKTITYNFFHWGPFLYKTKLTDEETNKIKKLCKKDNKKDFRKKLAGLIKNEYLIDEKKLFPIILNYLESYNKASVEHWNKFLGNKITLVQAWVNYMTKFESNPLHTHEGDLSFVIFTQVPEGLKKENAETISDSKPGSINFISSLADQKYDINKHIFFPEVNDMFIFPSTLNHCVNHFKSEGERISVSGNIKVSFYTNEREKIANV